MNALTRPRPLAPARPWPTPEQLQQMGLIRCQTGGCRTYLDPAHTRSPLCTIHQREERARRRAERFHHRPRVHDAQSAT